MKNVIITFKNNVMATLTLITFACCTEPSLDIDYTLTCSEGLLEYATPQVSYVSNGNTPVSFAILEGEWSVVEEKDQSSTINIIIDGDTITKSQKLMKWTKHIHYEDFTVVDDELTVTYTPKSNIPAGCVLASGFEHTLTAAIDFVDEDGNRHKPTEIEQNTSITIGGGKTLSEIISEFKDYKGYHVESNGHYNKK